QQLSKTLTINTAAGTNNSGFAWYAFLWASVVLSLLAYLGYLAYKKPFPPKIDLETHYLYERIGGWLILPLLTFLLTPFVVFVFLATSGYFDAAIWNAHQGTAS